MIFDSTALYLIGGVLALVLWDWVKEQDDNWPDG